MKRRKGINGFCMELWSRAIRKKKPSKIKKQCTTKKKKIKKANIVKPKSLENPKVWGSPTKQSFGEPSRWITIEDFPDKLMINFLLRRTKRMLIKGLKNIKISPKKIGQNSPPYRREKGLKRAKKPPHILALLN